MKIEDIHTTTHSLSDTHFGQAFDCLLKSRELSEHSMAENRNAISAIVHGFLGLESSINFIGDQLFFDEESDKYILPQKRDYATTCLIQGWSMMPTLKKIDFLFSLSEKETPPPNLMTELNELNTLRNWIVHGFIYKETLLLDETGENEYIVIDQELHIDWDNKFPNTKFNILHSLNREDANLALYICLEITRYLANAFIQPFSLTRTYGKTMFKIIFEKTDIKELLRAEEKT